MANFVFNNNNIQDQTLEKAVRKRDLEQVRALLSEGADVNLQIGRDNGTLLHDTSSVEMTKELLLRGARVNASNKYSETPLHSAITKGKGLELVRELLKHGANVNATNRKGNTALNHAVKHSCRDLEKVQLLLDFGADINIRNRERRVFDNGSTSLDNAIGDLACAKLLIKTTLIKHFDRDYRKVIDLTPYTEFRTYSELSRFLDDCVCEIVQMKTDKVIDNLSLYEFVIIKKPLHAGNKIADQVKLTNYPIYHDIISAKIKLCLERVSLLNKVSELQMYVRVGSDISNQDVKEKEVILNFDSTYNIAKYLSDDDLWNIVTAFYKHADQSLDTKLDEASTNSCVKRARLELE